MDEIWDSIVIGGGAAGLSAGLVLGRARRKALVVDFGEPSNRMTHGIGGLLGHNELPPAELYAKGRAEVLAHPTTAIREGLVLRGRALEASDQTTAAGGAQPTITEPGAARFALTTASGEELLTRTVVLATGMDYGYPQLPGFSERWGNSVFHCPFCHGWEVRGKPLGVLGDGPGALHRAILLTSWSDDVTVYLSSSETPGAELDAESEAKLSAAGVKIEREAVVSAEGDGAALSELTLADGSTRTCGGLLIATTLRQRSDLATQLGVELAPAGPVVADAVAADFRGMTNVRGVFAAGDVATQMPQISAAVSTGVGAAAAAVGTLVGAF